MKKTKNTEKNIRNAAIASLIQLGLRAVIHAVNDAGFKVSFIKTKNGDSIVVS